jgi:hypothetical protein
MAILARFVDGWRQRFVIKLLPRNPLIAQAEPSGPAHTVGYNHA